MQYPTRTVARLFVLGQEDAKPCSLENVSCSFLHRQIQKLSESRIIEAQAGMPVTSRPAGNPEHVVGKQLEQNAQTSQLLRLGLPRVCVRSCWKVGEASIIDKMSSHSRQENSSLRVVIAKPKELKWVGDSLGRGKSGGSVSDFSCN